MCFCLLAYSQYTQNHSSNGIGGGHISRYPGKAERTNTRTNTDNRNRSSSSNYRNNNNSEYKPGYLQDTLTSIRRSRERAAVSPSFSRTPSIRRSQNSKQRTNGTKYGTDTERPTLLRPTSLYYPSTNNTINKDLKSGTKAKNLHLVFKMRFFKKKFQKIFNFFRYNQQ